MLVRLEHKASNPDGKRGEVPGVYAACQKRVLNCNKPDRTGRIASYRNMTCSVTRTGLSSTRSGNIHASSRPSMFIGVLPPRLTHFRLFLRSSLPHLSQPLRVSARKIDGVSSSGKHPRENTQRQDVCRKWRRRKARRCEIGTRGTRNGRQQVRSEGQ